MGKQQKDRSEKYLEAYPDVFADIANVLIFQNELIQETELSDGPTESVYKAAYHSDLFEQRRDITKYANRCGIKIALIGLENQSVVDSDMVFRIMGYDYTSYRSQITSKLPYRHPVISAVLYFGKEKWNKPLSIRKTVQTEENLLPFIADYQIKIIDVPRLPTSVRAKLTSDFRIVADFFAEKDKPDYQPSTQTIKHVEAVLQMLRVFTGDKRYEKIENEIKEDLRKGVKYNMCEFAERMENQGLKKGIEQGELLKLVTQVCKKMRKNLSADKIADMLEEDQTTIEQIMNVAKKFAPDYDVEKIYQQLKK